MPKNPAQKTQAILDVYEMQLHGISRLIALQRNNSAIKKQLTAQYNELSLQIIMLQNLIFN